MVLDSLRKWIIVLRIQLFGGLVGVEDLQRLKKRGLKVGKNFLILQGVIIDSSHCWLISIGNNVTLSQGVHILAHDASTKLWLGYTKIGIVKIGDNVFIGAHSIILPNVRIGNNVIVGAGSLVAKDVPDNVVVAGNPAKIIADIDKYLDKHRTNMEDRPIFDENWTIRKKADRTKKISMIERLQNGIGYVE